MAELNVSAKRGLIGAGYGAGIMALTTRTWGKPGMITAAGGGLAAGAAAHLVAAHTDNRWAGVGTGAAIGALTLNSALYAAGGAGQVRTHAIVSVLGLAMGAGIGLIATPRN
jgi:hypothetical protein